MKEKIVNVVGAGLAGCECAYKLANSGIKVKLYEMKKIKKSPAHKSDNFAELVCSNSLKSDEITNACGLLKKEMILDISTTGVNNRSERIVLACNKLIKSEIFQNLRFPNRIHEDEFMIHRYILQAKKIVWTDAVLYYYRQHDESITGKKNRKDLKHLAVLEAVRMRIKAFSGNEYEDVFLQVLFFVLKI